MTGPLSLRDIHQPSPVSWWPPAPGWWLAALLIIGGGLALLWWLRRRRQRHYRRAALAEANRLFAEWQHAGDIGAYCAAVNALLKRTAMKSYPAASVAPLSGPQWLAFLDRGLRRPRFNDEAVAAFADPYQRQPDVEPPALHAAATRWIRSHRC